MTYWERRLAQHEAFITGETVDASSPYLNAQPRDKRDVALEIAAKTLRETALEIEYLHLKFTPTGSGNAVLAKARAALADINALLGKEAGDA